MITNKQVEDWFNNLTEIMKPILGKEIMVLAAIWLDKPIMTDEGKKRRITEGMEISVDGSCQLTHKIIGCYGTVEIGRAHV